MPQQRHVLYDTSSTYRQGKVHLPTRQLYLQAHEVREVDSPCQLARLAWCYCYHQIGHDNRRKCLHDARSKGVVDQKEARHRSVQMTDCRCNEIQDVSKGASVLSLQLAEVECIRRCTRALTCWRFDQAQAKSHNQR